MKEQQTLPQYLASVLPANSPIGLDSLTIPTLPSWR